jgi:hypothetical protein
MSADDAEKEIRFIANLCEIAPSEIEKLDMADYLKVQDTLASFYPRPSNHKRSNSFTGATEWLGLERPNGY